MTQFPPLPGDEIRFVADMHFRDRHGPGEADRRGRFIRFLESTPSGATLFLIGDVFDFYFEYRSVVAKRYFDLFFALRRCRDRGVDLHFIGGNHDYWVGEFLPRELGVETHNSEVRFEAQGRRVVCAHGDLVMPRDWGYKALKTVLRNRAVIALSRWIHPDIMHAIATGVADGSRHFQPRSQLERARQVADWGHGRYFSRGNDVFVMGHVHHPLHDARDGRDLLIVGDWITGSTYGRLSGGRITLETFTG